MRADSGSLFDYLHHCRIEDFWTFVRISHTMPLPVRGEMTDADIHNILGHIGQTSVGINRKICIRIPSVILSFSKQDN